MILLAKKWETFFHFFLILTRFEINKILEWTLWLYLWFIIFHGLFTYFFYKRKYDVIYIWLYYMHIKICLAIHFFEKGKTFEKKNEICCQTVKALC